MEEREQEEFENDDELESVEPDDEIETLKAALNVEKIKAESNLANWQRAQADFVNYKRRSEQEKEETAKFANAALILSILPILDDLERAFSSIPSRLAKASWIDGVRLIDRKLRSNLEMQGVTEIKALGEPFDPNLHEAAMHGNGAEGIVVGELQKGYKMHDRVIRPTKVIVGNGEEEEKKEE
jgi:molecular chaperone GrpE